ncbi:MAG TPA: energy-coupling factor ABC transporter ATP-binding protein [Candidatus Mediterraneibacter norfolkensis]|nr:energy-coupling factor ABC transporter ATP-binding protein [Candidatus Mediterraneibacter norfolkensis]
MGKTVVQTEDLVHTYPKGGVTALKGVNLKIEEGDIVSIVGQNGSGKTTLVRHFNGLLRPTSGCVKLLGEDTAGKSVAEMSHICGYVFQNPNHQIFCTTVKEELEVAPANFGFDEEKTRQCVDEVVEMMKLKDILNAHPMTLDYTSKKIVTIASVLVFKPTILVLDEPTGGLDEVGRQMLTQIIDMMHDIGHTVVMISHDMDYVAEVSNRIIVMAEGQIQDDGIPEKIFTNRKVLKHAQVEPPQISQLDLYLSDKQGKTDTVALTVEDFIKKYK